MEQLQPSSPATGWGRCKSEPRLQSIVSKLVVFATIVITVTAQSAQAQVHKVRISGLSDVNFGLLTNLPAESRRSQNICLFSSGDGSRYSISASGSGPGGSFALANGASALPYDVEWSEQSGQTAGTQLSANDTLIGQTSAATQQFCNNGPATSASLTIILRSDSLSLAREGSYTGSLTVLISAE